MKKNFLIMMIMVLCAGLTFAQNHNTVRGFVPGAAGNQTYAVFGQMFGDIDFDANPYQAAEGLAQAQIVGDTLETVVGCGDSLSIGEFKLTVADVQKIVDEFADDGPRDTFLTIQHPNAAIYNYDQLLVLHLFVCPCTVNDADGNPYEVIAIDNTHCWTKSNMRTTTNCAREAVETMSYTSEIVSSLNVDTFGLLYKWNQAMTGSDCDSIYKTGICPCGWHLPTAAETARILEKNTDDLRSAEGDYWVVAENITNLTKFSAQPSGYYKGLAERFEGYHSEADFWFADNDSTCKPNYFQILYYCDKPKQEPRNDTADAMSVRCVLDMLYDYHKDDPTPNCSLSVGTPAFTDASHVSIPVAGFYNYHSNDNAVYGIFYFYHNSEQLKYTDAIFDTTAVGGGDAVLGATYGNVSLSAEPDSIAFYLWFNLGHEYYYCAETDGGFGREAGYKINDNSCPSYESANEQSDVIFIIPVSNYTPGEQDQFTVTPLYYFSIDDNNGQAGTATCQFISTNNTLSVTLQNPPADFCGVQFSIQLNGQCQATVSSDKYCH